MSQSKHEWINDCREADKQVKLGKMDVEVWYGYVKAVMVGAGCFVGRTGKELELDLEKRYLELKSREEHNCLISESEIKPDMPSDSNTDPRSHGKEKDGPRHLF